MLRIITKLFFLSAFLTWLPGLLAEGTPVPEEVIQRQATLTDYTVIIGYMALMVGIGFVFTKFNKNADDFLRGGCRSSWWMVGMSAFMSGFSAWTFTGAAGAVYEAGYSVLWIYWSQAIGYLVAAVWLAPWFRQLRVTAFGELTELRYSKHLAQFSTWFFLPLTPVFPAITLYALAIFCSSLFGFDIEFTILVLGIAILLYSTSGGVWGVMATDFLQGIVLIPFTILVAVLALMEIGGVGNFLAFLNEPEIAEKFAFVKPEGAYEAAKYTWLWGVALALKNITGFLGMNNALRYRSCKDGKEARKAALLAAGLLFVGPIIWFIPPAVGLMAFSGEVMASGIAKPTESAYAITALNVLPVGLVGIMIVAMFSATMSSMDTSLANGSANIVKIIYPGLCKLFKKTPTENPKTLLLMSRIFTFLIGGLIIGGAILVAQRGRGVFELMLTVGALTAGFGLPYLWGTFVKKVPSWCPYFSLIVGVIPAFMGLFSAELFGESWNFQTKFFATFITGNVCFFGTMPFWRWESDKYKKLADDFFIRMKTPVNVLEEIGDTRDTDSKQLKIMGIATMAIGLFIAGIGLFTPGLEGKVQTWIFAASIAIIGAVMYLIDKWKHRPNPESSTEPSAQSDA